MVHVRPRQSLADLHWMSYLNALKHSMDSFGVEMALLVLELSKSAWWAESFAGNWASVGSHAFAVD